MTLDGLQVAITGAGRDTGRSLALAFAERGAHLFVSARDPAAAQTTVDLIRQRGRTAEAFACDLAAPASVRDFAVALGERVGYLDVLINNGAGYVDGAQLDATILLTKHPGVRFEQVQA